MSTWRIRRPCCAPSATRTANSRCRAVERAKLQIGNVDARDQQYEQYGAHQHNQHRTHFPNNLLFQGNDRRLDTGVNIGISGGEPVIDPLHVLCNCGHRHCPA